MNKLIYRKIQHVMLFMTVLVLSLSFYFEYVQGLQPCPLCLMQRVCAFIFGFCCMVSLCLLSLKRARIFALSQVFFAASGLYFAGRQIWLQFAPMEESGMCMPGLQALSNYLPWDRFLKALFWGAADCGAVTWRFLGLSMPMWAAGYFLILFLLSAVVFILLNRSLAELPPGPAA